MSGIDTITAKFIDGQYGVFFWLCLYTEQEIINTFENSVNMVTRRNAELAVLDSIVDKYGQTRNYYLSRIKLNVSKNFTANGKALTFDQLKSLIESNSFTFLSRQSIVDNCSPVFLSLNIKNIARVVAGCPDFQRDFTKIVSTTTMTSTPFNDDVTNTDTQIKSLRDEALSNRDLCLSATSLDDVKKYAALVVAASEKAATLAAKYNTSVGKNAATQAAGYATEATTYVNTKVAKQKTTILGAGVGVLALGLFMFGTKKRK